MLGKLGFGVLDGGGVDFKEVGFKGGLLFREGGGGAGELGCFVDVVAEGHGCALLLQVGY